MAKHSTEIARWDGRIAMSKAQRYKDKEARRKFTRWYENEYWPGGVEAMDESDPDHRQTNYVGMFVRAMEASMYAQAPTYSCVTPGNPNALNQLFANVAGNIPEHVGLRRTSQLCSLDAILGRFGIAQVGYDAQLGWDSGVEDEARQDAQEENERFGREDVRVKDYDADDVHIEEHAAERQRLIQANPMAPPTGVIGEMDRHMRDHAEAKKKKLASPLEYVKSKRAWVTRVRPVVNGE
ncbi:MAG: hypothetical protein GY851_10270, partial [bacterium]|nr:hypothetical protein [bacterium]